MFPMQMMSLLRSIAPRRLGNEWALTGEPFDARIAQTAGLPAKQSTALTTVTMDCFVASLLAMTDRKLFRRPGVRRDDTSMCTGNSSYPAFAFSPAASMPAIAQISSLSEVSPLTPTAPSRTPPSWISTPPGTGTIRPCASVFTALMK